jgi:hypothetical protein
MNNNKKEDERKNENNTKIKNAITQCIISGNKTNNSDNNLHNFIYKGISPINNDNERKNMIDKNNILENNSLHNLF